MDSGLAGWVHLVAGLNHIAITTVSTSSGRTPARATAARIAVAPRSGAGTSLRLPPKVPIAVLTGSAKTTERDVMTNLHWQNSEARETRSPTLGQTRHPRRARFP